MEYLARWALTSAIVFIVSFAVTAALAIAQVWATLRLPTVTGGDGAKPRAFGAGDISESVGKVVDALRDAKPLGVMAILTMVFFIGTIVSYWLVATLANAPAR